MPTPRRTNNNRNRPAAPAEDSYGHVQPQNLEMERAVLGAIMIEQDAYTLVSEMLQPESFYDTRHQLIYNAVRALSSLQKPVDLLTIIDYLDSQAELEKAGGPAYITELTSNVVTSAHIEYHARIIAQKYLARQLITFSSQIQTQAFDATIDVDDLMQQAEGNLFAISQQNLKKDYTQIDPVLALARKQIENAAGNRENGGISGLSSGFPAIDKITNGWQNSDLIIIAARPAMGKTAFVLSMARKIAIDMRIPVAMFSLEMSNVQLVTRLIVNVTELSGEKIKSGDLKPYEWGQLDSRTKLMEGAPLYVDDTASLSVFELRTKARRLVREHGVRLILIDYLQLMNASGMNFGSRQEEVSMISRSLKGLAKELDIPIIALSQLNRNVEKRDASQGEDAKRPQLSDLRESGAIEQDADMVCFLHRPDYYNNNRNSQGKDQRGNSEFIIAKHRNGATDIVPIFFRHEHARFLDYSELHNIPMPGETMTYGSAINADATMPEGQQAPMPTSQAPLPPANDATTPFGPPPSTQDMPF